MVDIAGEHERAPALSAGGDRRSAAGTGERHCARQQPAGAGAAAARRQPTALRQGRALRRWRWRCTS